MAIEFSVDPRQVAKSFDSRKLCGIRPNSPPPKRIDPISKRAGHHRGEQAIHGDHRVRKATSPGSRGNPLPPRFKPPAPPRQDTKKARQIILRSLTRSAPSSITSDRTRKSANCAWRRRCNSSRRWAVAGRSHTLQSILQPRRRLGPPRPDPHILCYSKEGFVPSWDGRSACGPVAQMDRATVS
jgi:hypothetical protein